MTMRPALSGGIIEVTALPMAGLTPPPPGLNAGSIAPGWRQFYDASVRYPADRAEVATRINISRRILRQRTNDTVRPNARIEGEVERSVGVNPGNSLPGHAVHIQETASNHYLSVRLETQRASRSVRVNPER